MKLFIWESEYLYGEDQAALVGLPGGFYLFSREDVGVIWEEHNHALDRGCGAEADQYQLVASWFELNPLEENVILLVKGKDENFVSLPEWLTIPKIYGA